MLRQGRAIPAGSAVDLSALFRRRPDSSDTRGPHEVPPRRLTRRRISAVTCAGGPTSVTLRGFLDVGSPKTASTQVVVQQAALNGGYLKSSLSTPHLTRTSAA